MTKKEVADQIIDWCRSQEFNPAVAVPAMLAIVAVHIATVAESAEDMEAGVKYATGVLRQTARGSYKQKVMNEKKVLQ